MGIQYIKSVMDDNIYNFTIIAYFCISITDKQRDDTLPKIPILLIISPIFSRFSYYIFRFLKLRIRQYMT